MLFKIDFFRALKKFKNSKKTINKKEDAKRYKIK
jgi:hypothetical protein